MSTIFVKITSGAQIIRKSTCITNYRHYFEVWCFITLL